MKKIISMALALVMLLTVAMPVFAATTPYSGEITIDTSTLKDTDDDGIGDTEAEEYIITIPADTTIPWGEEETDVSYSVEAHLKRGKTVAVAVSGNGAMSTADGAYTLAYTLGGAGVNYESTGPVVYDNGAVEQEVKVLVSANDWNTAVVEEYSDILTYAAEVKTA